MQKEKQKVRCLEIQCLAAILPFGSMGAVGMAFWDWSPSKESLVIFYPDN